VYLAMDEIGSDNISRLRMVQDKESLWAEIDRIAAGFGFQGIQFTSSLYESKLGLSLRKIPSILRKYRLTYHIAGIRPLASLADEAELEALLQEALDVASENAMEDVSLHPPRLAYADDRERETVRSEFARILKRWVPRYADQGITLSLESHSSCGFFVFDGLLDFSEFVRQIRGLGVLVDISHLWNDGNNVELIASALKDCRITGLHVSDALEGVEITKGTHLPIGEGEVDFAKLLPRLACNDLVYAVFEIKAGSSAIRRSIDLFRGYLGTQA